LIASASASFASLSSSASASLAILTRSTSWAAAFRDLSSPAYASESPSAFTDDALFLHLSISVFSSQRPADFISSSFNTVP
jgi:hypothetical protein